MRKALVLTALVSAAAMFSSGAYAHGGASWGVTISVGGPPAVYVEPRPVYLPAPVYVAPPAPQVVYYPQVVVRRPGYAVVDPCPDQFDPRFGRPAYGHHGNAGYGRPGYGPVQRGYDDRSQAPRGWDDRRAFHQSAMTPKRSN